MSVVNEVPLPGIGVRYEFTTEEGFRLGVVHHRTGERELVLYERADPDTAHDFVRLGTEDARTLAELLGVSQVAKDLADLEQGVEGLAVDRLPLAGGSPFDGRTIGDTGARSRTGVSIVAVLRPDGAHPAPEPTFQLAGGDVLVVVGTPRGIEDLALILRSG
ncbi:MAG TPA: TrkA C-terminal domain-containing protein [Actinomycetota bacterium]|nr:TrkA C-terminal domain-containing protein [Actinomycetota bacterium]